MVIFDTNILIELYRGNERTREAVLTLATANFYISAITVAEFLVGARNKQEMRAIRKQLTPYTMLPITEEISAVFINLFQDYSLSHKPSIPDTFIAATALYYDLPVLTLNKKDFQYFPNIKLL
ncbi:type II toxin-antitoxin system VapC family toxin [Parapedobacter tibetensis]|uniref:type II toxin-antitoxin system VapC family toxin n=1 Tax=Parapedobacter tibetensis TaxID=2972951 RepID=UPI00214D973D|nr:type II toxin-antitoxin system VapC family toxin [Parapedobacter tibetensis]